jgi:hypothetical protein
MRIDRVARSRILGGNSANLIEWHLSIGSHCLSVVEKGAQAAAASGGKNMSQKGAPMAAMAATADRSSFGLAPAPTISQVSSIVSIAERPMAEPAAARIAPVARLKIS